MKMMFWNAMMLCDAIWHLTRSQNYIYIYINRDRHCTCHASNKHERFSFEKWWDVVRGHEFPNKRLPYILGTLLRTSAIRPWSLARVPSATTHPDKGSNLTLNLRNSHTNLFGIISAKVLPKSRAFQQPCNVLSQYLREQLVLKQVNQDLWIFMVDMSYIVNGCPWWL